MSQNLLETHLDKEVTMRAVLRISPKYCLGTGSPCACSSHCSGALQLVPSNPEKDASLSATLALARAERRAPLDNILDAARGPSGGLVCAGDEASICCPLRLDSSTRVLEVIVTGEVGKYPPYFPWRLSGDESEYEIKAREICRLH